MPGLLEKIARPAIFAHRGASAHAPENTLAAFRLAVEQGADGIELDAKLTADGKVVVIHDQTVNRTTGGQGLVCRKTLAQLKALDAGRFFSPSFTGEKIPTLEEVFAELGAHTIINVEITNYLSIWDTLPERVADLVIQYNLQEHVLFSSFQPLNLARIHRRLPGAPLAILTYPGILGSLTLMRGWLGRRFAPELLHPYFTDATSQMLQAEHQRGRQVIVWTVNHPEDMHRLFQIGIDGIITDDPHLARRVLEEK